MLHWLHRSLPSLSWIAQRTQARDLVWLVTGMSSVVARVSCENEILASLPLAVGGGVFPDGVVAGVAGLLDYGEADGRYAAVAAGALPVDVVDPGVPPDAGREGRLDGVVLEQQVVGVGPAAGSLFVTHDSHDPREGAVNAVAGGGEVGVDGQGGEGARYGDDGAVGA